MNANMPVITPRDLEAAEWCLSLAEGELNAAERADFDLWITDDTNAEALERAARVWRAAGEAAGLPEVVGLRSEAMARLRAAQRTPRRQSVPLAWASGAAAAVVGMLVLAVLLFQPTATVYRSDVGERQIAILADGSRLSLDADTEVRVDLSRDRRDLVLTRGRAKFDVVHDALRPFTVGLGDKTVVVTGTSFSVELLNREARVLLYEGQVSVMDGAAHPGGARSPTAALQTTLRPGTGLVAVLGEPLDQARQFEFDPAQSLGWEAGRLDFDDEPLALAVERLNRYSGRKVVLADPGLNSLPVNGVFAANDVGAFLEAVTAFHAVQVTERDGVVTLRPS